MTLFNYDVVGSYEHADVQLRLPPSVLTTQ